LIEQRNRSAADLLGDVKRQAQQLVADVRRVVHDLRPPALDELGLAEALRGSVAQLGGHPQAPAIDFAADGRFDEVSAAAEAAAYRITLEAVNNVIKHAQAAHCWVRLAYLEQPPYLEIRIEDDGIGLPQPVTPNVGLRSMRERAEELGGEFHLQSRPMGGTRVTVRLPLSSVSHLP
jgi:signal transduction histidine kinase